MFSVSLLQGGLPGPGLGGASPTLALTPQCGLDVATEPCKPQCAAGAGAGLGWLERKGAQDGAVKTPTTRSGDLEKAQKAYTAPRRVAGVMRNRGEKLAGHRRESGLRAEPAVGYDWNHLPSVATLLRGPLRWGQRQRKRDDWGGHTLPPDSARAGTQGFLCPFLSSLGQNPRESKERQKAKDSRVGSWQSRGGGAGTWWGEGGRKSPWALGLPQDGGQRQEMEARGKGEQQGPGRGLSGPGGQVLNPQHCSHSPPRPRAHTRPPTTTPISPSTRPRKAGPPQKATFKLRQTWLSPPPP